jgi:Sec-independent protein translocase protein TatA
MKTIGPGELLMIVLTMGLLLGANRLPQMAGSLGEGIGEPRCALHEGSQLGKPDTTQGPGNDTPPER